MADKYRFFHRARVRAPIDVAWEVFTNHERIGEFTNTPMTITTPGKEERDGLGCIRRLDTLGVVVLEIVNIWRKHEVYGYHVIDSDFVESHQGVVRFFPTDEGCEWVYDMQNVPFPASAEQAKAATGLDWQEYLGREFRLYMADLEAECERRADACRIPSFPPSTKDHALFD